MKTALQIEAISKRYGEFTAVNRLSMEVPAGTIFGVLGPNGAGKTTTLRMINDIIAPDEGTIRILEQYPPGREAATHIGYLPEERGLYPKMRVGHILRFFGELHGLTGADAVKRSDRWLARLELAQWKNNRLQDLSKGMQQKIQFITTVLHDPQLLILDEPWSGLDPINAEVLREIVLEYKRAGHTVLFSTHLMEQAEKLCDSVFIIARGRRVLAGALTDVKREAAGDRWVSLGFADGERPDEILSDPQLIARQRPRDGHLEVEMAPGVDADQLLQALVAAGGRLRRFELLRPTLHQIFVDRVGAEAAEGRRE